MMNRNVFIDFTAKEFNYYNNSLFKDVVEDYLAKNPEVILSEYIIGTDLARVYNEVLMNDLSHVKDQRGLYRLIELIYDHWRNFQRYLIADLSVSYAINPNNYGQIFTDFNDYVLTSYRNICTNLLGKKFTVMRELPAGGNAFVLLNKNTNSVYEALKEVKYISNIIFRPPFVVYSESNKRKGIFPIINESPLNGLEIINDEWLCYPILVGNSRVAVYFKKRYMSLAMALSNLFEHDDSFAGHKPDMIVLFGTNTVDGVYYDEEKDLYVASLVERDEIDYFGYLKKIILTVYNIKMINSGYLPIHGAGVSLTLKDHRVKNIVLIGDSGAGKSETLEALRTVSNDYILDMKTIFDDMGTFILKDDMKAYGTEIGAFVRIDDLENDYVYRVFDRAIFMNPHQTNARLVLPVSIHDDIVSGYQVDMFLYANNYDESEQKIKLFKNKAEALHVFKEGKRMAKGTTAESGLVETFFANPFGPVQLQEKTEILLDAYFDHMFNSNVEVGQIYTGLGLPDGANNPIKAAVELLAMLKEK